jgi:hypothetical protein
MARRGESSDGPQTVVYYHQQTGAEYPVTGDVDAVEAVQLRAWGYGTEKPKDVPEELQDTAGEGTVASGGPLSGAATPEG